MAYIVSKENSTETEAEPYRKSLSGTVVEIGADYILIDDSVLCVDENDGMVFKAICTNQVDISEIIDNFAEVSIRFDATEVMS